MLSEKKISISDVTRNQITSFWIKRIMLKNKVIKRSHRLESLVHTAHDQIHIQIPSVRPSLSPKSTALVRSFIICSSVCSNDKKAQNPQPNIPVLLHVELFIVSHFRRYILRHSLSSLFAEYIGKSQPWKWNLFHQMLQVWALYVDCVLLLLNFFRQACFRLIIGNHTPSWKKRISEKKTCNAFLVVCVFFSFAILPLWIVCDSTAEQFQNDCSRFEFVFIRYVWDEKSLNCIFPPIFSAQNRIQTFNRMLYFWW